MMKHLIRFLAGIAAPALLAAALVSCGEISTPPPAAAPKVEEKAATPPPASKEVSYKCGCGKTAMAAPGSPAPV